jgi:hypothetical protein
MNAGSRSSNLSFARRSDCFNIPGVGEIVIFLNKIVIDSEPVASAKAVVLYTILSEFITGILMA